MDPKDGYESLNEEILFYQFENYIDEVDTEIKKSWKDTMKKILMFFGPVTLLFIMYLITQNLSFIYGMLAFSSACALSKLFLDFKKDMRNFSGTLSTSEDSEHRDSEDLTHKQSSVSKLRDIESYYKVSKEPPMCSSENEDLKKYNEALKKQLRTRKDTNQKYEESLKKKLQSSKGEDRKKYQIALEKQLRGPRSSERKKYDAALKIQQDERKIVEKKSTPTYTKKSAIIELFKEIKIHQRVYNLPPIMITSDEWNAFFETVYNILKAKDREQDFYRTIRYVVRRALVKALVKEQDHIILQDIIDNLSYLGNLNFIEDEINEMVLSIKTVADKGKIIQFKPKIN